jgi:hypothetical protein
MVAMLQSLAASKQVPGEMFRFDSWTSVEYSVIAVYLFVALVTFGFLFRNGKAGLKSRAVQTVAAVLWPVYWVTIHGLVGTISLAINQTGLVIRLVIELVTTIISLAISQTGVVVRVLIELVTTTIGFTIAQSTTVIRVAEELLRAILDFFNAFVPALRWAWIFGMVTFPAFYVATQWGACNGSECLGIVALALLWAPFWPVYGALYLM